MKKIVFKEDFALLYLNKEFYKKKHITDSIKTYKDFLKGKISEMGNYFVIKVEPISKTELETASYELLNYILATEFEA